MHFPSGSNLFGNHFAKKLDNLYTNIYTSDLTRDWTGYLFGCRDVGWIRCSSRCYDIRW